MPSADATIHRALLWQPIFFAAVAAGLFAIFFAAGTLLGRVKSCSRSQQLG